MKLLAEIPVCPCKNLIIFSTIVLTFFSVAILYNKSTVLFFNVSSVSSKHSITEIWCGNAKFTLICTILANDVNPNYFKLWFSDLINFDIHVLAFSSKFGFGYIVIIVLTHCYTNACPAFKEGSSFLFRTSFNISYMPLLDPWSFLPKKLNISKSLICNHGAGTLC